MPSKLDRRRPGLQYSYGFRPFAAVWGILLLVALSLPTCSGEKEIHSKPQMSVPVTIAQVTQKDVPLQIRAIGNVEPYSVVSIKALVAGELTKVEFKEGQDVKKGDLLFVIDPRPFEASLKQAEANLGRDKTQVQQAEANLAKDMSQVKQAEANLARDLAQLRNAQEQAK